MTNNNLSGNDGDERHPVEKAWVDNISECRGGLLDGEPLVSPLPEERSNKELEQSRPSGGLDFPALNPSDL